MRIRALGTVIAALVGGCSGGGMTAPGTLKDGVLQYRASNQQGTELLAGSLRLAVHTDSTVTGTWQIDWVTGADTTAPVGPQVGHGTLSGRQLADGSVELNLNPLYADNNVFLNATVTVAGLSGEWSWSGFAGPIANGRFQAAF
ncbi:MAG TPA: hypothetical protein VFP39_16460 [Gemmatimonadales bacterium]|nr:hypothetical protein [Gemmatimonadales bacterium]